MLSIGILLVVFVGIACRQCFRLRLQIWQIMALGALAVLCTGQISLSAAWASLDWNVLAYLFGVFLLGRLLEDSGVLERAVYRLLKKVQRTSAVLLLLLLISGVSSGFLLNDTVAMVGAVTILLVTVNAPELTKPFLLGLAYAITVGSLITPVGNPQNMLIAADPQVSEPFLGFFEHFALPSVLSILVIFIVLRWHYASVLSKPLAMPAKMPEVDACLARKAYAGVIILLIGIFMLMLIDLIWPKLHVPFCVIALLAAAPAMLSNARRHLLKTLDWGVLLFFVAMFILVKAVWLSGEIQAVLMQTNFNVAHAGVIIPSGVLLSQLISNVPLVALYLPLLHHAQAASESYYTLAYASTLAGTLLFLGAASNIIIIQVVEKRGHDAFHFKPFFLLGLPITLICLVIFAVI